MPERSGEIRKAGEVILGKLLAAGEVKSLTYAVVSQMLNQWSAGKPLKLKISGFLNNRIQKQLSLESGYAESSSIIGLFDDAEFRQALLEVLPLISDSLEKMVVLAAGELKTVRQLHETDPLYFSKAFHPVFERLLSAIDFGELKETVESSEEDIAAMIEMINHLLWQHPAKLVILLSFLSNSINTLTSALRISLSKANEAPPDLVSDLITSIMKEIDPEQLVSVIDEYSELIRKVHTGSALIGDPGSPRLEGEMADLVEKIYLSMDYKAFLQARHSIADFGEFIQRRIIERKKDHPDIPLNEYRFYAKSLNRAWRGLNYRLSAIDDLDDEAVNEILKETLSELDTQEAGEVLNNLLLTAGRIREIDPMFLNGLVSQISSQVDWSRLQDLIRPALQSEAEEELTELGRAIIPGIVTGVCRILQPRDDEFEESAARARKALRELLMEKED